MRFTYEEIELKEMKPTGFLKIPIYSDLDLASNNVEEFLNRGKEILFKDVQRTRHWHLSKEQMLERSEWMRLADHVEVDPDEVMDWFMNGVKGLNQMSESELRKEFEDVWDEDLEDSYLSIHPDTDLKVEGRKSGKGDRDSIRNSSQHDRQRMSRHGLWKRRLRRETGHGRLLVAIPQEGQEQGSEDLGRARL